MLITVVLFYFQIILAHQKAFDAEKFERIKKILPELRKNKTAVQFIVIFIDLNKCSLEYM